MSNKINTEIFINKARLIHGSRYGYTNVDYVDSRTKVVINCPKHGDFEQSPSKHINPGSGCLKCYRERQKIMNTLPLTTVISSFNETHGGFYDYSKVVYVNARKAVEIVCPEHGVFKQTPNNHKKGQGCRLCANEKIREFNQDSEEETIAKFIKRHGNRYDYTKLGYTNSSSKVNIICPEHGVFSQTSSDHMQGSNCPKCVGCFRYNTQSFIKQANIKHDWVYDYSKTKYEISRDKVIITCIKHGDFEQAPAEHLYGKGCSSCANLDSTESVILKFRKQHGDFYDYGKVDYINARVNVVISCPKHGDFKQNSTTHIRGHGCPQCGSAFGVTQNEISDYIASLGFDVKNNVRGLFSNKLKEADILIESKKLIIEYNGLYWHSEARADNLYNIRDKTKLANEAGYRCIHVMEDDYLANPEKIKSLLRSALGIFDHKIGARKTSKRELSIAEYKALCGDHLQGYRAAKHKHGLFHNDELVAAIGYNESGELIRYVVKNGWLVQGALPKLLKGEAVTFSFCDLTFFTGSSYHKAGFELDYITEPNYVYVKHQKTRSRQQMMKHKLHKVFDNFDASLTEVENCNRNGWYRLFDAGNIKFTKSIDFLL